jgi:hypothetical protein
LTGKEYKMLELLALRKGMTLPCTEGRREPSACFAWG